MSEDYFVVEPTRDGLLVDLSFGTEAFRHHFALSAKSARIIAKELVAIADVLDKTDEQEKEGGG